jgi:peptidyl-Lys metalloendopeptidase
MKELTYLLSTLDIHVSGKPVMIDFVIDNGTPSDLWVLTWYTPLEGMKGEIFQVICDGIEMKYQGRMVKRADPTKKDYKCIRSGESETVAVDLTEAYAIPVCRKCRVTFCGEIHDMTQTESEVPRPSEKHQKILIKGNSLIFPVIPDSP